MNEFGPTPEFDPQNALLDNEDDQKELNRLRQIAGERDLTNKERMVFLALQQKEEDALTLRKRETMRKRDAA